MIIEIVLCRKSTDLSWDGEEPCAAAGEDGQLAEVEESAPLPQTETTTQATEAAPQDATMVEGTLATPMLAALHSSRRLRF
jgi:hypothetical protein